MLLRRTRRVKFDRDTDKCDSMTTTWPRYASAKDLLAHGWRSGVRCINYLDRALRQWAPKRGVVRDAITFSFLAHLTASHISAHRILHIEHDEQIGGRRECVPESLQSLLVGPVTLYSGDFHTEARRRRDSTNRPHPAGSPFGYGLSETTSSLDIIRLLLPRGTYIGLIPIVAPAGNRFVCIVNYTIDLNYCSGSEKNLCVSCQRN